MTDDSSMDEVIDLIPIADTMRGAVAAMETVRTSAEILSRRSKDVAEAAAALHRLSGGVMSTQHAIAAMRDRKVAQLHDEEKWPYGRIAKRTTIERTLVVKMVVRGRRPR